MIAVQRVRSHQQHGPLRRERRPRNQGSDRRLGALAALDEKSALGETVDAERRAQPTADKPSQRDGIELGLARGQCHRAGHGQRELGAGAESAMLSRRRFHDDMKRLFDRQRRGDLPCAGQGALGERTVGRPTRCPLDRHHESGPLDHHAGAAEDARRQRGLAVPIRPGRGRSVSGGEREQPKVQPARGADANHPEYCLHAGGDGQGRDAGDGLNVPRVGSKRKPAEIAGTSATDSRIRA